MADVDTDDHDFLNLDELWKLDSDGLTTGFGVDLLHDVRGV